MYKYILMLALLVVMLSPIPAQNAETTDGMTEYILEYLNVFPNLTYTEVRAGVKHESNDTPCLITEEPNVHDISVGPLQVRTKTLRGMGYTGPIEKMLTWKVGLYWGMKYMSICKKRAKKSVIDELGVADEHIIRRRMYSLYNAGNLYFKTVYEDGKHQKVYKNRNYVKKCEYYYWLYLRTGCKLTNIKRT